MSDDKLFTRNETRSISGQYEIIFLSEKRLKDHQVKPGTLFLYKKDYHFEEQVVDLCKTIRSISDISKQQTLLNAINTELEVDLQLADYTSNSDKLKEFLRIPYDNDGMLQKLLEASCELIQDPYPLTIYKNYQDKNIKYQGQDFKGNDLIGELSAEKIGQKNYDRCQRDYDYRSSLALEIMKPIIKFAFHNEKYEVKTTSQKMIDRAFIFCVNYGFNFIAELFLKIGADAETNDKDGESALSLAYQNKAHSLVKTLLGKGADIHSCDIFSALFYPQGQDSLALMLGDGAKLNIRKENIESLEQDLNATLTHRTLPGLLVNAFTDPDVKRYYVNKLFRHALKNHDAHLAKIAIEHGAKEVDSFSGIYPTIHRLFKLITPERTRYRGEIAFSANDQTVEIAKLLLNNGANPDNNFEKPKSYRPCNQSTLYAYIHHIDQFVLYTNSINQESSNKEHHMAILYEIMKASSKDYNELPQDTSPAMKEMLDKLITQISTEREVDKANHLRQEALIGFSTNSHLLSQSIRGSQSSIPQSR